jgi:nicotinate phosphoribosyltransferase
MVTGGSDAAFTGVYKLAAMEDETGGLRAAIKFSENPEKTTNPGVKQVWRIRDSLGLCVADVLALEGPEEDESFEKGETYTFWHPSADYRHFSHTLSGSAERLLKKRLEKGSLPAGLPSLENIRALVRRELDSLDQSYKRILNPHIYKVSVTGKLRSLKLELIKNYLGDL